MYNGRPAQHKVEIQEIWVYLRGENQIGLSCEVFLVRGLGKQGAKCSWS